MDGDLVSGRVFVEVIRGQLLFEDQKLATTVYALIMVNVVENVVTRASTAKPRL